MSRSGYTDDWSDEAASFADCAKGAAIDEARSLPASKAELDALIADKVREAVRSAIDEAGIILAEAEIECGHKHVKAFRALEAIRERGTQ